MSLASRANFSPVYSALRSAIAERRAVRVQYKGHVRDVCPHTLGWKNGYEKVLTYQYSGGSSSGLPSGGEWRCMFVSDISSIAVIDTNAWHTGTGHSQPQTCVDTVDIETV